MDEVIHFNKLVSNSEFCKNVSICGLNHQNSDIKLSLSADRDSVTCPYCLRTLAMIDFLCLKIH